MIGAELQEAIFAGLITAPALAGGRVYDEVPPESQRIADTGAAWPYVTIGDEQVIDDSTTCQDGWEVYPDVHCWSRPATGSKVEVKELAAAVVARVTAIASLDGLSLISITHETTRVMRDPDGLTEHAVVSFVARIDAL